VGIFDTNMGNNGAPVMIEICPFDQESGFLRLNYASG